MMRALCCSVRARRIDAGPRVELSAIDRRPSCAYRRDPSASRSDSSRRDAGQYFVFDRRAHAVYAVAGDAAKKIIDIGAEPGRVLDPSAFDIDPADGSFVVADAPLRRPRIQVFTAQRRPPRRLHAAGAREAARVTLESGRAERHRFDPVHRRRDPDQPARDRRARVGAVDSYGEPRRTFGQLRATGQEADPNVHLRAERGAAARSIRPAASTSSSSPACRSSASTTRRGRCCSSATSKARSSTTTCRRCRHGGRRGATDDGDVLPLVPPAVRAAGVDRQGRLWIALMSPFTYVYDRSGDKIRTVQFRGADMLARRAACSSRRTDASW